MTTSDSSPDADQLLLVTGSGRSGTSSLAGSLNMLGWHVPEPVVKPAERNSKGHFEPLWSIRFHKRHLDQARIAATDSRPDSAALMSAALDDGPALEQLTAWLGPMTEPRVVVKDPHAPLFIPMWRAAAAQVGRDLRVLVIARHPAEVVGSRDRTWGQDRADDRRLVLETRNTAQWLNTLLVSDANSRGLRRAFITFDDLLADWRTALGRVSDQLGLGLDTAPGRPHALDSWLDPDMKRVALTWDDLRCSAAVSDLAESGWSQVADLVERPDDPAAMAVLDEVRQQYTQLYGDALALVDDELERLKATSRTEIKKLRARVKKLRAQVDGQPVEPPAAEEPRRGLFGRR